MKKACYLFGGFIGISILLGCCYYFSFRNALLHYNKEAMEQNTELLNQLLQYSDNSTKLLEEMIEDSRKEDALALETTSAQKQLLHPQTRYYLETYHTDNGTMQREELPIPGFMVGLSRDDLITYINGFMEYMPINEYLNGLTSYEVISFSTESVTLRKTYDAAKVEFQYYICEKDGRVTIYYSDLKTVYEYTEILCEELAPEIRAMVEKGFYVKDAKELYGVLEGYTS